MTKKQRRSAGTIAAAGLAAAFLAINGPAAAQNPAAPGGAVSAPHSPQNGAINTDGNKGKQTQTPGANSFTMGQAKGHIEKAGYTDVAGLKKTSTGTWAGKAKKDGKTVNVSVDFKGAVSAE